MSPLAACQHLVDQAQRTVRPGDVGLDDKHLAAGFFDARRQCLQPVGAAGDDSHFRAGLGQCIGCRLADAG